MQNCPQPWVASGCLLLDTTFSHQVVNQGCITSQGLNEQLQRLLIAFAIYRWPATNCLPRLKKRSRETRRTILARPTVELLANRLQIGSVRRKCPLTFPRTLARGTVAPSSCSTWWPLHCKLSKLPSLPISIWFSSLSFTSLYRTGKSVHASRGFRLQPWADA